MRHDYIYIYPLKKLKLEAETKPSVGEAAEPLEFSYIDNWTQSITTSLRNSLSVS